MNAINEVSVKMDIINVFKYLKEMERQKKKLVINIKNQGFSYLIVEQLLNHDLIRIIPTCNAVDTGYGLEVFKIKRPIRTNCPKPSNELQKWLYSGWEKYDGEVIIKRDETSVLQKPHTVLYKVNGVRNENKINVEEAKMVVSLIIAAIALPEYKDCSFGVISLLGGRQAKYIDNLLRKKLDEREYFHHQILCGDSSSFQGDERDVIIMSMVDSPNENGGPLILREDGKQNINKKRYNVATSRARNQLWLIYSLNPDIDLKPTDIRRRLIKHLENPKNIDNMISQQRAKTESVFEAEVISALIRKGFNILPQWEVGAYRIDMIALGPDAKVAIECDGEKWHGDDKLIEDMQRQAVLERLGWEFIRIRGNTYFSNPEKTINDLVSKLNEKGIYTIDNKENSNNTFPLKERLIIEMEKVRKDLDEEEPSI